jgi:Arc/MetJ-type ribon-helix-helix transcriptional regulator
VKVSLSIPEDAVTFLDEYARTHRVASRSATVQRAIALLRASELSEAYTEAFAEEDLQSDDSAWDNVISDGLGEA